ncbi:MAG: shikimate kinase [Planctomycetaceae bacterium]
MIGYRGCGKTSVARLLAEKLGWDWIDADVEIEKTAGKTIAEIFQDDGEPCFRDWEQKVIQQLLERSNLVLASGGGSVMNAETRQAMQQAGSVVWLKAPATLLAARIEADALSRSQRPSLTGKSIGDEVADVLKIREPVYEQAASLIIDTEQLSIDEVSQKIEQELARLNQEDKDRQS